MRLTRRLIPHGVLAAACAPRATPLAGAPTPAAFPRAVLPTAPQQVVFRWRYEEADGFSVRGEGVARTAAPDSARLDFFLDGGFGRGYAILIGDRLSTPANDGMVRRVVPPAPMLWAAIGRLAVPGGADTTARVSGDTLRADIGSAPVWRVTFVRDRLTRLERIDNGRVLDWVSRDAEGAVRYQHEAPRRALQLEVVRTERVEGHDASVWRR